MARLSGGCGLAILGCAMFAGAAVSPASAGSEGRAAPATSARAIDRGTVRALLYPRTDLPGLQRLGPAVMPVLADLYLESDTQHRAYIAGVFYQIGFKSPEAKRALLQDAHTGDKDLRLQVQWALGRVSNDPEVVDVLLENMQNDANPLFRDKAACALAHDQIFLTEEQKVTLFARLIQALRDPKLQVRISVLRILEIQTGQTRGFDPRAPFGQREQAIRSWESWLQDYRSNL